MRDDCLLAAIYPGIPGEYLEWPDTVKDSWHLNIPYVLAELEHQRAKVGNLKSAEGVYENILARTGDKDLASKVWAEIVANQKLAATMANQQQ